MTRQDKHGTLPRRFAGDRRGSVALLLAALMVVLLWSVAFAVDAGSLYFERRKAQGATDLAALAAAQSTGFAERAAFETLRANEMHDLTFLSVVPGRYAPDSALPPEQRFAAGAGPANAVQVRMRRAVPLYFAGRLLGIERWEMGVEAVAVTTEQAAFSIGSRLARLEGGVLNALLGALLGGTVTLSAMDYENLAQTHVKLFDFLDALATGLDVTAASYDEVLSASVTGGQALEALAVAASAAGAEMAAAALRDLAAAAGGMPVPLARVLALGPYGALAPGGPPPGLSPEINILNMVSVAAAAADGDRQASFSLGAAVPGLADVRVDLAVGERPQSSPWLTIGERGAVVRTAQTRLKVSATVAGSGLLSGVALRVPIFAELAQAQARLDDLACGAEPRRDGHVRIAARPGVAELWLAEADARALGDFTRFPALARGIIMDSPALKVTGFSHAAAAPGADTLLTFDWDDIESGRVKSTATDDATGALLRSLIRNSDLEVSGLGLGLGLGSHGVARDAVRGLLVTAAPALSRLIDSVLEGLGVSLGQADIRVEGLRCDGSALVG